MESEKTSIDILKSFAKKNGWDSNFYKTTISKRQGVTYRKAVLQKGNLYFISRHQAGNLSKYDTYSGIFIPVTGKLNSLVLTLRNRDVLDKLSFRKNKLRFKIGSGFFDSKVLVETNNDVEAHKLLSSSKIQTEIVDFLQYQERLYIGVNEIDPKLDALKDKSFLSVHTLMGWMLSNDLIEKSIKIAEMLNNKMTNRYV